LKKNKAKDKPIYDKDGRWVEERGRIKGAIRRAFRLHPALKELLQEARVELPPKTLKDGSLGKKNQVRYRCASCGELFSQKNVQVDHINTVIPLDKSESEMSFEEWIVLTVRGIFCKKENLQVLCSTKKKDLPAGKQSCHGAKTARENFIREEFKRMKENSTSSIYKELDGKSTQEKIAFFSKMYDDYMVHKEEERLAKERRKLERLAKRKSKK
jgi:5-methylcytosine-specific restriction endonuclease McrA